MPYVNLLDEVFDREISLRQSYEILVGFVRQYHARGESPTGDLLSDISVLKDHAPLDPAQIPDFLRVAACVLGDDDLLTASDSA